MEENDRITNLSKKIPIMTKYLYKYIYIFRYIITKHRYLKTVNRKRHDMMCHCPLRNFIH